VHIKLQQKCIKDSRQSDPWENKTKFTNVLSNHIKSADNKGTRKFGKNFILQLTLEGVVNFKLISLSHHIIPKTLLDIPHNSQ
jgi:hypothetical protein